MTQSAVSHYWVVIPAAGVGRRMADIIPKQYLPLAGRSVIEWAVAPFLARADINGIVIAHARNDDRIISSTSLRDARVKTTLGGAERADTVLLSLETLSASDDDWVLVHDAARPCLHADDLARLLSELSGHAVGGLLASPVSDTLKSADATDHVQATVPRDKLWRALTPQMFRYGLLRRALLNAKEANIAVTDEAAAIEALGFKPKLVSGRSDNIKITVPEDLAYAEYVLRSRGASRGV